ncbi:MAG: hypothetical protein QXE05_10075, partial [Nitrososphaeria archaeon]
GVYYSLDVNKVMRLTPYSSGGLIENPFYIPPERFGELTGLYENGHWKYGFRLFMKSALDINVTTLSYMELNPNKRIPNLFKVDVTTYNGKKASNAVVIAKYLCFVIYTIGTGKDKSTIFDLAESATVTNITNFEGSTILDFRGKYTNIDQKENGDIDYVQVIVLLAKYYGLQSETVLYLEEQVPTLDLILEGNILIAKFNANDTKDFPKAAHHVGAKCDITVLALTYDFNLLKYPAVNVTRTGEAGKIVNRGGKNYTVWALTQDPSSDVFVAGVFVKTGPRGTWFAFTTRPLVPQTLNYSSSEVIAGIKTETLSRIVTIGRNSYYAELTLWRMAE